MNSLPMDVWQKAVEDAKRANRGDEGFTTKELCSMFKVGNATMKRYLGEMIRLGKVVSAGSFRPAIDGIMRYVPVYILKGKKE